MRITNLVSVYKYAIIVAAGSGTRMGQDVPKQFLLLHEKPVLWHTLRAFTEAYSDIEIILVIPSAYMESATRLTSEFPMHKIAVTPGGATRFDSVKRGLQLVTQKSIVFVHDGVRCLVSAALIHHCYEQAIEKGNAVPAVVPADTIRIETSDGNEQVDRNNVRLVQTPQTFSSDVLIRAFARDYDPSFTDEASVVERSGERIHLVEGELGNIKITRPVDLVIAAEYLRSLK